MESRSTLCSAIGILLFLCIGVTISSQENTDTLYVKRFEDNDARTRHKRNASVPAAGEDGNSSTDHSSTEIKPLPVWMKDVDKWYGWQHYTTRKLYKNNPHQKPMVCFSNTTRVEHNHTVLNHFICPMQGEDELWAYCCGKQWDESCCHHDEYVKTHNKDEGKVSDIDLATGLGIVAVCVGCVSFCMFLYCCCCQRRPEIHDGIKMIWVRRSFGKEHKYEIIAYQNVEKAPRKLGSINRLEQPTYPNHLAVVSSRAGSRNPSRAGSRQGSRQGSRNPSVCPSPSVSRRGSNTGEQPMVHLHPNKTTSERKKSLDVPSGSVTITVTTPSDEHGPTEPLLKTAEQKVTA